jgi:hypothetical protein
MDPRGKNFLTRELHETIQAFSIKLRLFSNKRRNMKVHSFLFRENTCLFRAAGYRSILRKLYKNFVDDFKDIRKVYI